MGVEESQSGPHALGARPTLVENQPPATKAAGRDRRAYPRLPVDATAAVFFIDVRAQIAGRILDISLGGCRIRAQQRFPVGIYRRVETEFKLDGMPFRLAGVVQAVHDRFTIGIRFLDMSSRKRDQLAQLMADIEETKSRE
jgi:c-di-GMP-binding flagellar brake protein YcgR